MSSIDRTAQKIQVGTAAGVPQTSTATCDLALPHLPADFRKQGTSCRSFMKTWLALDPCAMQGTPSNLRRTPSSDPTKMEFQLLLDGEKPPAHCRPTPPPNLPPEPSGPPIPSGNKVTAKWLRKINNRRQRKIDNRRTAIVDSGASIIYLTPEAPMSSIDRTAPKIRVGTAAGVPQTLTATCDLALPHLPADFP